MPTTRAVFFDLDGTLCDRDAGWRSYLASQRTRLGFYGVPLAHYQTRALELEAEHRLNRLRVFQQLQAEFNLPASPEVLLADFRSHIAEHTALYEGARELLESLRDQGLLLGLVSNGSVQAQQGKLDATGLTPLFGAILISEAEGLRKPDVALFERAAHTLGVNVAEYVFVGDDPVADVGGAQAAGMLTLWLSWGRPWPLTLDFRPSTIAQNLSEVGEQIAHFYKK